MGKAGKPEDKKPLSEGENKIRENEDDQNPDKVNNRKIWKEGDSCVTQWKEDKCWYKSIIRKIESKNKVLVEFYEYGNSDYTSMTLMRPFDTPIGKDGQLVEMKPTSSVNR